MNKWNSLDEDKKQKVRDRFQHFENLPPEKQDKIRERYKWFKDLPPEKSEKLREKWQSMSPEEHKQFSKKHKNKFNDKKRKNNKNRD